MSAGPAGDDPLSLTHRRFDGSNRGRIFDAGPVSAGANCNWLSGHQWSSAGVGFHDTFLWNPLTATAYDAVYTSHSNPPPTPDWYGAEWGLYSDQRSWFRNDRTREYFQKADAVPCPHPLRITINDGSYARAGQPDASDFAVAVVLIYNRVLSAAEVYQVGGRMHCAQQVGNISEQQAVSVLRVVPPAGGPCSIVQLPGAGWLVHHLPDWPSLCRLTGSGWCI